MFLLRCSLFIPKTVQLKVHLLVFILCCLRAAFFGVAISSWNPSNGIIDSGKIAFYSLDEFGTMLFFSLTSILALFWAELYYISIDEVLTFTELVRPVTYILNIAAYVVVGVCIYLVAEMYTDEVDYVFIQYSVAVAVVYLIAAIIFGYYAVSAGQELNLVPIQLSARRSRMRTLKLLAIICISALIIRAVLVILLAGHRIETTTQRAQILVFFYYFLLELIPIITAAIFYKVEPLNDTIEGDEYETAPLNPSRANSNAKAAVRDSMMTPDDVISSIIDKLSRSSAPNADIS
jgi:hypothetical protein